MPEKETFTLVVPGVLTFDALDPADVALSKRGVLRVHNDLLAEGGFTDRAAVLVDTDHLRVALRPPKDGEGSYTIKRSKKSKTGTVNISRAIRQLGFDPDAFSGRVSPTQKGPFIILNLCEFYEGKGVSLEELAKKRKQK